MKIQTKYGILNIKNDRRKYKSPLKEVDVTVVNGLNVSNDDDVHIVRYVNFNAKIVKVDGKYPDGSPLHSIWCKIPKS